MSRLLARLRTRPATALIVVQLAALVVLGAVTALRFHVFAAVDELAHVSYVQDVAEQGALPWEGRTFVSPQMEAIEQNVYPRPSSVDPRLIGAAGLSYEGFQPPLYYVLAVPAFEIPSNYRDKVIAVRLFDLVLLLAAAAILALLARAAAGERWQIAYAATLAVLLWPGVLVRAITVSNAALELPLALLYVLAVWHASSSPTPRRLLGAGALLGLCLLTGLTLIFLVPLLALPLFAALRAGRDRHTIAAVAGSVALPVVILAPWIASNLDRYGALTPGAVAKQVLAPLVDPTGVNYGIGAVISRLWRFDRVLLPQEWWSQYDRAGLDLLLWLIPAALAAAALVAIARRPRSAWSTAGALLAAPLPLGIVSLAAIVVFADWPSFLPRYVNPAYPLLALFAVWAFGPRARPRVLLAAIAGYSALVAFVWVYMAGAFYFTHVGASLGIHR